jgi:hypothetical protein
VKFPYTIFPSLPDAAFPGRVSILRPVLVLVLQKGTSVVGTLALVDSGADSCIFPASLAGQLGITIPNQRASVFSGTANSPQIGYYESVRAQIWDTRTSAFVFDFELYAGFCDSLEHIGLGLLGQDGFFSRFSVKFDRQETYFEIDSK